MANEQMSKDNFVFKKYLDYVPVRLLLILIVIFLIINACLLIFDNGDKFKNVYVAGISANTGKIKWLAGKVRDLDTQVNSVARARRVSVDMKMIAIVEQISGLFNLIDDFNKYVDDQMRLISDHLDKSHD